MKACIENSKISDLLRENKQIRRAIIALSAIFFLVLFVVRLFHGIETSDEAYYVVTGYRLLQGNIPFGDMWEINAGTAYIMLPFFWIRSMFVDGNEGLFIYSRLSFMIMNSIGAWSVYYYSKKDIEKTYAFYLSLFFLFCAPFQLYNFSYNNLSSLFMTSSVSMIMLTLREEKNKVFFFFSGVFMALAVLVYPTMIICCVIIGIIILIMHKFQRGWKAIMLYATGGIIVAFPILIHLSCAVGLGNVLNNLSVMLSSDITPPLSPLVICSHFIDATKYLFGQFSGDGIYRLIYFCIILLCLILKKTRTIAYYLLILLPFVILFDVIKQIPNHFILSFLHEASLLGLLSIVVAKDRIKMAKKCLLEWGISLLPYYVVAFSSGGGFENARDNLVLATVVSIKLLIESIQENSELKFKKETIYMILLSMITIEILLFYVGRYSEEPYPKLTDRIESGVYKGIYTTPGRKRHINDLENILSSIEDKDETVMILYHCCYSYLMVDMIPKITSSWGCVNYEWYGFDNQDLILSYLKNKGNIPDNIIIIDIPEEYDYEDQQAESFEPYYPKLIQFIKDHYVCEGEYEKGSSGKVIKYEVDNSTF